MEDRVGLKDEIILADGNKIDLTQLGYTESNRQDARDVLLYALDGHDGKDIIGRSIPGRWKNVSQFELPELVLHLWLKHTSLPVLINRALTDFLSGEAENIEESEEVPFDLDIAHAYAQWQSCLIAASDLNVLLGYPLQDFDLSLLRNGSQLHRIYHLLKTAHKSANKSSQEH